jgi:hypothetical protein
MRKLILLEIIALCMPSLARAWCNTLPRLICAEYSNSELVVIVRVIRIQHVIPEDRNQQDGHIYTLEANRILRGKVGDTFDIYEENSSGRAPFVWKKGEEYLLFLNSHEPGKWWLYGCGNSAPLKAAGFALRTIESMKTRRGGLVHGLVRVPEGASKAGISVRLRGESGEYKALTDRNGEFRIHVPSGRYEVRPIRNRSSFTKSMFSYEDPSNLLIEDGGCAQIEFETSEDR